MNKYEKMHLDRVAALGCIVCRNNGLVDELDESTPAVIHHINHYAMGKKAPNFLVIPLCGPHHTDGGYGIAIHGGKATWEMKNGTEMELLSQTIELLYLEG